MNGLTLHKVVDVIIEKKEYKGKDHRLFDTTEIFVIDKNGNKFTITCFMEEKDENTN